MRKDSAPGSFCEPLVRRNRFESLLEHSGFAFAAAFVDERVAKLHPHVRVALAKKNILVLQVKAGESLKSMNAISRLLRKLPSFTRHSTILAIGGGTVGDTIGFLTHIYKRGLRVVHVPTTVLAAVDSSIGGKTALNIANVKNMLGAFHYPKEIWVDSRFFETLTETQRREGKAEALKTFLVCSKNKQKWPEQFDAWLQLAQKQKQQVCREDPYELSGLRRILNFGHTMGHVIEALSHYRIRHGMAVAIGMLCALDVGVALSVTSPKLKQEVERMVETSVLENGREKLKQVLAGKTKHALEILTLDKKNQRADEVNFVLLENIGKPRIVGVPLATLKHFLQQVWA